MRFLHEWIYVLGPGQVIWDINYQESEAANILHHLTDQK